MDAPTMTQVSSSNLHSVGHDGAALFIRFLGKGGTPGRLYRYPTAGRDIHDLLVATKSPGSAFLDRVRHQHRGELIDG